MKNAKIFLTALTVLAVAGGALAFKTKVPKIFAQCDIDSLKCIINPTTTLLTITNIGGEIIDYAEFAKPCVFDVTAAAWICRAQVTFSE